MAVAVTVGGATVIAGRTSSPDFPTTPGAYSATQRRMFVSRLDPTGSRLEWSTYFGSEDEFDRLTDLGVDGLGNVTLVGYTDTGFFLDSTFPTTEGAFDTQPGGAFDGFVATLDATGSRLLYSTFLGGGGHDEPQEVAVDSAGVVTVLGHTFASDFPVTPGALQTVNAGGRDAFVTRLSPTGEALDYSTYFGGSLNDGLTASESMGLAMDATGDVVIAGVTFSPDVPITPGAVDTELQGTTEAFIARLDMLPTGASKYGVSTAGCAGPLAIGVTAMPQVGAGTFALTCTNAPPSSRQGLLVIGTAPTGAPASLSGAGLWLDLTAPWFRLPVASNAAGYARVSLPLPADAGLAGISAFVQFVWRDPCAPGRLSASNALALSVQP